MPSAEDRIRVEGGAFLLNVSVRKVYALCAEKVLTLYRDSVTRRSWLDRREVEALAARRLQPAG